MQCPKQTLQTNHQITIKIKDCVKRNRPKLSIFYRNFAALLKGVKSTVRILELNLFLQSIKDRSGKEQWEGHLGVSAHWLQSGGAALRKVSLEDNCTKPDIAIRFAHLDLH